MNSRQRVLTALNHQEADRVPFALMGGSYGMVDDLYLGMLKLLNLGEPVKPFRTGHSISYMDDRLLKVLGTDTRYCWPGLLPNSPTVEGDDDNFFDSYGQEWKKAKPYYYAGKGLLSEVDTIEGIDANLKKLDLTDPRWTAGLLERAKQLREENEYFVIMRMAASHGPFQTACDFRGTENFLMDMALNPKLAQHLLEKVTDAIIELQALQLKTAGPYFDMIELPGDDYAGNQNLLVSPRMFRKFIKPCIQRMIDNIREHNPEIKIMLHSDGAITKLIPDIIDVGVDVLHPLEPLPAMDLPAIKADFGDKLSFIGGLDISHGIPGSKEEVISEVKTRLTQLAPGGGYIMAPSNHLQADVPPENVITMLETAREFGAYPLKAG